MFSFRSAGLLSVFSLTGLLWGATAFADTTFDMTSCPSGQTCLTDPSPVTGNTLTFTSGGLSITGEAFSVQGGSIGSAPGADTFSAKLLGLYNGNGLGVGADAPPDHALDNSPRVVGSSTVYHNDFIVFQLPANQKVVSIALNSFTKSYANNATVFIGSNSAFTSLSSFSGTSLSTIEADFTQLTFGNTNTGAGQGGTNTDTLATPLGGQFLIIATALTEPSGCNATASINCDYFKVASVVTRSTVPEPSSLALLLAGVGFYAVKRRRNKIKPQAA